MNTRITANDMRILNRLLYGSVAAAFLAAAAQPALAQSALDQDDQQQEDLEEITIQKDLNREGPDVVVKQTPPTVMVEQPKPTVTVTQPEPKVTIRQPAPVIRVIMPEPEVTIEQPEPVVKVEMPEPKILIEQNKPEVMVNRAPVDVEYFNAEPVVEVQRAENPTVQLEQAGQPEITFVQAEPKVIIEKAQQGQALARMTGEELVGRRLVMGDGQPIGDVTDLVADKQKNRVFAVVDLVDAVAGPDKTVVVPMQRIRLVQGTLQAGLSMQQVEQAPAFNQSQYQALALDVPIGEFAMFSTPASQPDKSSQSASKASQ